MTRIQDLAAERSLLSCLMLSDVDVPVSERDFDSPAHRIIFAAIASVRSRGARPDPVTLAAEIGGALDRFGGRAYLLEVSGAEIVSTNAAHYAEIVADHARRRRLVEASVSIKAHAEQGADFDPVHLVEDALSTDGGGVRHISLVLRDRMATIGQKREYVWLTDFPGVHLHFGDLAIIAARPGVGKSALALQFASEFAARGLRTRVYSLEMHASDWLDRLIMRRTPFDTNALDDGLSPEAVDFTQSAMAEVASWPLEICDRNMGVTHIVSDIRRFGRRGGRVVFIDYLQLLVGKLGGESRYEAVTEASRLLKVAAQESGVLVVALSQLSRGSIGSDGKARRPVLSDLRESGALEQDADDVLLIHRYEDDDTVVRDALRKKRYLLEFEQPICDLHFAKLRRGVPKVVPSWWCGSDQTFTPIDKEADE